MHSRYLSWMIALTVIFVLRVIPWAAQWVGPVSFLPPFDAWQGSGLACQVLLPSQVAVAARPPACERPAATRLAHR